MTEATWKKTLLLLEENERRLASMRPSDPIPTAKFWRESAHGTLGHLTACQSAWLPYMRQIQHGATKGSIPIRPDPLYRKAGFATKPWKTLLSQFKTDRAEWRAILLSIDPTRELETPNRTLSAQSLTKRMVDHEHSHLNQL
jgi:hypothetical protein